MTDSHARWVRAQSRCGAGIEPQQTNISTHKPESKGHSDTRGLPARAFAECKALASGFGSGRGHPGPQRLNRPSLHRIGRREVRGHATMRASTPKLLPTMRHSALKLSPTLVPWRPGSEKARSGAWRASVMSKTGLAMHPPQPPAVFFQWQLLHEYISGSFRDSQRPLASARLNAPTSRDLRDR